MTFVSYAQNFEDLMLYRALGHIEQGFYVDVGAQHAVRDSVTAAFYERGWRGINIEPVRKWARLLRRLRPRDINVQVAISPDANEMVIHEVAGGLSTTVGTYADAYRTEGRKVRSVVVPAMRLDRILYEFAPRDIHFLKIDVEGAECAVLESVSLQKTRPWILVIEATRPNSQEPASGDWEHLVLSSGYRRVYSDGLNLFFLADERMDLASAFEFPPNIFDQTELAESARMINRFARRAQIGSRRAVEVGEEMKMRQALLDSEIATLSGRLAAAEGLGAEQQKRVNCLEMRVEAYQLQTQRAVSRRAQLAETLHQVQAEAARAGSLAAEIAKLRGSLSWLVTAPLRLAMRVFRRQITLVDAGKESSRWILQQTWARIRRRVELAQRIERVVALSPPLHRRLQRIATGRVLALSASANDAMSARTKAVFDAIGVSGQSERM